MAALTVLSASPAPPRLSSPGSGAAFEQSSRRIRPPQPRRPPRPEYVPNRIGDPNYVRISTTLPDREQHPSATAADELLITKQLAVLGVDIIVVGFPGLSTKEFHAVRSIATEFGNPPLAEASHVPVICALSGCSKEEVDKAWEAVRHAPRPRINMLIPTSKILMKHKLGKRPHEVVAIAKEMVAYARNNLGCPDVQFTAEDACRSRKGFLYRILQEVIEAGATTISISDTDGHILPEKFGNLIADIKEKVPGISNVIISIQCKNCHGLATAHMLQGVGAGARQVEVKICGSGERATGNASMEEVVVVGALECHINEFGDAYTAISSHLIHRIRKMVKDHNGGLIEAQTGTSGAHTSAHGRIHQVGSSSPTPTNDSDLSKKGFLSSIHDLVSTLLVFNGALAAFSYSYPTSPKALVSLDNNLAKGIFISNGSLWLCGIAMFHFCSYFKNSESIDHVGFDMFLGMLRLWLLSFVFAYCTTLHVFMQISLKYICAFGVASIFGIVFPIFIHIEYQRPKIVKWGKSAWGALISGCGVTLRAIPAYFTKALKFCANLSWPRLTRVMEAEKSLPSTMVESSFAP